MIYLVVKYTNDLTQSSYNEREFLAGVDVILTYNISMVGSIGVLYLYAFLVSGEESFSLVKISKISFSTLYFGHLGERCRMVGVTICLNIIPFTFIAFYATLSTNFLFRPNAAIMSKFLASERSWIWNPDNTTLAHKDLE